MEFPVVTKQKSSSHTLNNVLLYTYSANQDQTIPQEIAYKIRELIWRILKLSFFFDKRWYFTRGSNGSDLTVVAYGPTQKFDCIGWVKFSGLASDTKKNYL